MAKKSGIITTSFNDFKSLVGFYNQHLRTPMHNELEVCDILLKSDHFTDREKAEILILGGHQRRLVQMQSLNNLREKAIDILAANAPWKKRYKSFEDLFREIKMLVCIFDLDYIGPLTIYDIAKRQSRYLNCYPKEFVYAWRHSLTGAMNLLKNDINLSKNKQAIIPTSIFSPYFLGLDSIDVENILCIMCKCFSYHKVVTTSITIDINFKCHILYVNINLAIKIYYYLLSIKYDMTKVVFYQLKKYPNALLKTKP